MVDLSPLILIQLFIEPAACTRQFNSPSRPDDRHRLFQRPAPARAATALEPQRRDRPGGGSPACGFHLGAAKRPLDARRGSHCSCGNPHAIRRPARTQGRACSTGAAYTAGAEKTCRQSTCATGAPTLGHHRPDTFTKCADWRGYAAAAACPCGRGSRCTASRCAVALQRRRLPAKPQTTLPAHQQTPG